MTKAFELHKAIRARLLRFLDWKPTPEQLALIPEGFHNNILWNIAHCVVTQQLLCYKLAGVQPPCLRRADQHLQKGYLPRWAYPKPRGNRTTLGQGPYLHFTSKIIEDYQKGVFAGKD